MTNIHSLSRSRNTRRRTLTAAAALAAVALALVTGAASAEAAPAPPKPTLVAQVPFDVPASFTAGVAVGVTATIWHLPAAVDADDVIAWVTCTGTRVPSAYPVTKIVDHTTRRILLSTVIESSRDDRDCVLNAVPTALGTHVAFSPAITDASTGAIQIDGDYVVEGVIAR
ncbi:hypothetical protein [Subtercola endophyticus]|uniref:hypothetical protein n=1 Tax=Subtercola endophyticus TaxID=2895559 RepID=UPI001E4A5ED6|nr:hypothetical protein [Subtercola endophyticus]UFS60968.1 hypothetical protein LQ955_09655 [Subtercola endophyticus]